jgi:threonyl-tRNA synthetase
MGSTMISILKIKITEADFKKIEDSILEISRGKHEFKLRPVSKADALELYKDNVYKTEMITNLEDGTITFCDHDTFTDLCRGGYPEYRYYQSGKIMSVAGAYWRGEKQTTNTCLWNFISKTKDLTEYLLLLEEQNVAITEN